MKTDLEQVIALTSELIHGGDDDAEEQVKFCSCLKHTHCSQFEEKISSLKLTFFFFSNKSYLKLVFYAVYPTRWKILSIYQCYGSVFLNGWIKFSYNITEN